MEATKKQRKSYGISPERPNVSMFGRYTIAQAAKEIGASVRMMRNWFNDGLITPINYNATPVRISGKEITRFWEWKTGKA